MAKNGILCCFSIMIYLISSFPVFSMDPPPPVISKDPPPGQRIVKKRDENSPEVKIELLKKTLSENPHYAIFFDMPADELYDALTKLAAENDFYTEKVATALQVFETGFYPEEIPNNRVLLKLIKLTEIVGMKKTVQKALWNKTQSPYREINIFSLSPLELANVLTVVQAKHFKKIRTEDFRKNALGDLKQTTRNDGAISSWLRLKVLLHKDSKLDIFKKLYETGQILHEKGNFASSLIVFNAMGGDVKRIIDIPKGNNFPLFDFYMDWRDEKIPSLLEKKSHENNKNDSYLLPCGTTLFLFERMASSPGKNAMLKKMAEHHNNLGHCDYYDVNVNFGIVDFFMNIPLSNLDDISYVLSSELKPRGKSSELRQRPSDPSNWNGAEYIDYFTTNRRRDDLERLLLSGFGSTKSIFNLCEDCENEEEKAQILSYRLALDVNFCRAFVVGSKPFVKSQTGSVITRRRSSGMTRGISSKILPSKKYPDSPGAAESRSPHPQQLSSSSEETLGEEHPDFDNSGNSVGDQYNGMFKKTKTRAWVSSTSLQRKAEEQIKAIDPIKNKKFTDFSAEEVKFFVENYVKNLKNPAQVLKALFEKDGSNIKTSASTFINDRLAALENQKLEAEKKGNEDDIKSVQAVISKLMKFSKIVEKQMYFEYFFHLKINVDDAKTLAEHIVLWY